jgi:hypothetical protein
MIDTTRPCGMTLLGWSKVTVRLMGHPGPQGAHSTVGHSVPGFGVELKLSWNSVLRRAIDIVKQHTMILAMPPY